MELVGWNIHLRFRRMNTVNLIYMNVMSNSKQLYFVSISEICCHFFFLFIFKKLFNSYIKLKKV